MTTRQPTDDELRKPYENNPWLFWHEAPETLRAEQLASQRQLTETGLISIGERCYIAPSAALDPPESLVMGDRSFIAAYAQVMGEIVLGRDCSINPYADVRGRITMGDGVRMGAQASLLAFNHGTDPGSFIHEQPVTTEGIVIGDDVWIGSHAVVVDGVSVGDHCVHGAGAIVTRDVAPWSIVGGNPARLLRDRRVSSASRRRERLGQDLAVFADTVRSEMGQVLQRSWLPDGREFVDKPGEPPTIRAFCDAVELSAMFMAGVPPMIERDLAAAYLVGLQDPATGVLPPAHGRPETLEVDIPLAETDSAYSILCVGYALELLGGRMPHPIQSVVETRSDDLVGHLDRLPWRDEAWTAGAWVDSWGTALAWAAGTPEADAGLAALIGWLSIRCDPMSGMWGAWSVDQGRRQLVNGFYRAVRGTFAQFGYPVPYPMAAIDTTLTHLSDTRFFRADRGNACDVLDVTHTFWLCGRQVEHRRGEVESWASRQLERIMGSWWPAEGFSFELSAGSGADYQPGLQGTEMWLATAWLLADILGVAQHLGYVPHGIHHPEPRGR
jgi:acetyltransferase-like isoleucine patch superfamily enzyme